LAHIPVVGKWLPGDTMYTAWVQCFKMLCRSSAKSHYFKLWIEGIKFWLLWTSLFILNREKQHWRFLIVTFIFCNFIIFTLFWIFTYFL
jgi:hypothetical protein